MRVFLVAIFLCCGLSGTSFANHHKMNYNSDLKAKDKNGKRYYKKKKWSGTGGAIDNFAQKTIVREKNKNIKSPIHAMNVGPSNRARKDKDSSIKEPIQNRKYSNVDGEVVEGIYDDMDVIMRNGRYVGYYKVGDPYKIDDLYYYPQEYENYEEIGVASWYGEDFDGKLTANGEIYDLSMMTAAHRTLPMPSIVKVTNLANQKSVLVRVNDRGPFAKNRIIDLSKKASEVLDYRDKGTIMVKVELDNEKTAELREKLKLNIK